MMSNIETLAQRYRQQLKQRGAHASQQIEAAHQQAKHAIQPHLDKLYIELQKQRWDSKMLASHNLISWIHGKLDQVINMVLSHITTFSQLAKMTTEHLVTWASEMGHSAGQTLLRYSTHLINVPKLANPTEKLSRLFDGIGAEAAQAVKAAFTRAVTIGNSISVLAREVATALDTPRWRSLTIVDTELFRSYNDASMAVFKSNAQVCDGYVWICQLSPRSCASCVALHGTIHDLDDDLADHPNGSCIKCPHFSDSPDIQTGLDWFKHQDEATQKAVLGTNIAHSLYKSGTSLGDFIGINHDSQHGNSVYQKSAKQIGGK